MINILIALAVTVSPQLEAKADKLYAAGNCFTKFEASETIQLENNLKALPTNDYERGYLSVAFDAGKADFMSGEFMLTPGQCRRYLREFFMAAPSAS